MPLVYEDLDYPGGTTPLAEVQVTLAGDGCNPLAGNTSPDVLIIGSKKLVPGAGVDATGYWEINLVGNGAISPAGTVYRITRRTKEGATAVTCISVPVSGGPFPESSLRITPPGTIADSGITSTFLTARERELADRALAKQALAQIRADMSATRSGTSGDTNARSSTIVMLGDSLTEAFEPTVRGLMWPRHLSRRLNGHRMGGVQYLPASAGFANSVAATDWPGDQAVWTYSVTPTVEGNYGGDLHGVRMTSGSTATVTFFGSVITVAYTRTTGGPTAAAVTLDGVAQTAINAQGSELPGQQAVFTADGYGFHTLVITSTSGQLLLEGAIVSDNEVFPFGVPCRQVRTLAFGHAGFTSSLFVDRPNSTTSIVNVANSVATGTYVGLYIIAFGANDQVLGHAPSLLQSNLVTLMQRIETNRTALGVTTAPGFLLMAFMNLQQQYIDAMWGARAVFGEDRVGVLDLRRYLPGGGLTMPPIFDAAGHPNDAGQLWISNTVADFIDGESGTLVPRFVPSYSDDVVIEAATPADFRSAAWTESLAFTSTTSGVQYDTAAGASDIKERRHRRWLHRGTYEARLRYGEVTTTGGQAQVQVGGTTIGSVTTTGTTNNVAEASLGSIVIDSPGPYPLIIRKTALNTGAFRFSRLLLRKTA